MRTEPNPYLFEIENVLPRILASADQDPTSPTLGLGDRLHWAWKLQDYANATPQGVVHGLAQLVASDLLPHGISPDAIIARINDMILATRRITARDGSLVEAFPNEKSFCVTALIAFDILCAADLLESRIAPAMAAAWRQTAEPLLEFIIANDETHAIISNHLATAVAALMRWRAAGGRLAPKRAHARARQLLDIILANQSSEGWYCEYSGTDPGYETLGLFYLADVHLNNPSLGLEESLRRSLRFLGHFAHPDGSFGGIYGARNTRFLIPGGIEALAATMPEAAALARFARGSISARRLVTLSSIDAPNLAPHFNAYCRAAACFAAAERGEEQELPCESAVASRTWFPLAQLLVDNGAEHYTVVSAAKGGVVSHCVKDGTACVVHPGLAAEIDGETYTTQAFRLDNTHDITGDVVSVDAPFVAAIHERPTPFKFLILRILCLTVFRVRALAEIVKRVLVRRLIVGQRVAKVRNRRSIRLGRDLEITDQQTPGGIARILPLTRPFTAIHMASAGYWQAQDDQGPDRAGP